jgi:hypothetical protein
MGELLLPGACQPGLSSDRSARVSSAASVVVCEAQGAGSWGGTLPGQIPVPNFANSKAGVAHENHLASESLNCLVREPDAGNPPVRFDEREVETEQGGIVWHRQPKGTETRMVHLNRRATSRLYWLPSPTYRGNADQLAFGRTRRHGGMLTAGVVQAHIGAALSRAAPASGERSSVCSSVRRSQSRYSRGSVGSPARMPGASVPERTRITTCRRTGTG